MSSDEDEYVYEEDDEYEYEDEDTLKADENRRRLAQLEGVMMKLMEAGDKGITPKGNELLREAKTLLQPLWGVRGIDAAGISRTIMAIQQQMNKPVQITASDEDMARLCESDRAVPCYRSSGTVRISVVHPATGMRQCVCYDARELAEHVRNHGWTEPKFGKPLSLEQQARIVRALKRTSNGCFATQADATMLYALLGELIIMPSSDLRPGQASVPGEMFEHILKSADEARVPVLVLRVSSHNSAVFVVPVPREHSRTTTVMLSLEDYRQLTASGDDAFDGHLASLPVATSVTLDRDGVDMDELSKALDRSGSTLLRVGDAFKVAGDYVTIVDMLPACATIRPGIGTVAEIDVQIAPSEVRAADGAGTGAGGSLNPASTSFASAEPAASAATGGRARFRRALITHGYQRQHATPTRHHDATHRSLHRSGGRNRLFAGRYGVYDTHGAR
jgi:hypothetical protein